MSRRAAGWAAAIAVVIGSADVGCTKRESATASADASTTASTTASTDASATASADARALVVGACLSCHSEQMLAQQRLTEAQWSRVVTKMVGWGANLEPGEVRSLVAYLSASYGPDAGSYEPDVVPAGEAAAELAASDDPVPPGDPARGRSMYVEKCSGCHGSDARGHIGVALIDRPMLYRFTDLARTVRRGRGKMLPIPLGDAEIADVLAHLRALRNAPP